MDQSPAEGNRDGPAPAYHRHKPEQTCLYQVVERYWPEFQSQLADSGKYLPRYVTREFEKFLECGLLKHGFLRVRCTDCGKENLVAYSCKCRGFCTSCGARRMAETTALLVDDVLPHKPVRQWVLSIPWPLRLLLANNPHAMGKVLATVIRSISGLIADNAGTKRTPAKSGGVTLIQRFGSALNLNIHFHILMIDGVFTKNQHGGLRFRRAKAPTPQQLQELVMTLSERIGRCLEREGLLEREEE